MATKGVQFKHVYISPDCHGRLRRLVNVLKPKPKIGSLVEYLIDQECKRRCPDSESADQQSRTRRPRKKKAG